jgi:hypothetical protein
LPADQEKSLFALGEVTREYELYDDLDVVLGHKAPQALLRDLHRPVTQFTVGIMDFVRHPIDSDAGEIALRAARETVTTDFRVPICELVPTNQMLREGMAELRHILSLPWDEAPKLGPQYLPSWMARW